MKRMKRASSATRMLAKHAQALYFIHSTIRNKLCWHMPITPFLGVKDKRNEASLRHKHHGETVKEKKLGWAGAHSFKSLHSGGNNCFKFEVNKATQ